MPRSLVALAVTPFLLAACHTDGDPMTMHLSMVSESLVQLSTDSAAHKTAVAAAANVSALAAMETDHLAKALASVDSMKSMCDEMTSTCMMHDGTMANAKPESDLSEQMRQECNNHKAAMAAAADLAAANTEETRHQAALEDLRGKMQKGLDGLGPTAGEFTCSSGHSH